MSKPLQIFEYDRLKKDDIVNYFKKQNPDKIFSEEDSSSLFQKAEKILIQFEKYYDLEIDRNKSKDKLEIFTLIKDGVKFKQYVGVIRIGSLTIEVLPKIDVISNNDALDNNLWQDLLYKMIRKASNLDGKLTGFANLNFHANNFISMYIAYFVKEVAYLNRTGLIKKYHPKEGNLTSLKGRLNFSKQISNNLVNAERFYVNYSIYDKDNFLNQILFKALMACRRLNTNPDLAGKIESEILNFPEVSNISVTHATFDKIKFDRKSIAYKNAISLARFILMKLFPSLKSGQIDTIAVMYDMNKLFEKYIELKLKDELGSEYTVTSQEKINFWKFNDETYYRKVKPDIVVYKDEIPVAVLDTKWKIPKDKHFPSIQDLRQMFVYNQYYFPNQSKIKHAALVYPHNSVLETNSNDNISINCKIKKGQFSDDNQFGFCDVVYLPLISDQHNSLDVCVTPLVDFIRSRSVI